jgi:hypothetical protein
VPLSIHEHDYRNVASRPEFIHSDWYRTDLEEGKWRGRRGSNPRPPA